MSEAGFETPSTCSRTVGGGLCRQQKPVYKPPARPARSFTFYHSYPSRLAIPGTISLFASGQPPRGCCICVLRCTVFQLKVRDVLFPQYTMQSLLESFTAVLWIGFRVDLRLNFYSLKNFEAITNHESNLAKERIAELI